MTESLKRYHEPETSSQDDINEPASLYSLIKSHKNFSHFVEEVNFNDYLKFFTSSEANLKVNLLDNEENKSETEELLKRLAESVTSPNVVDLIVKNLTKNHR